MRSMNFSWKYLVISSEQPSDVLKITSWNKNLFFIFKKKKNLNIRIQVGGEQFLDFSVFWMPEKITL